MNDLYANLMSDLYVTDGVAEYVMTLFPKEFVGVCVDIGAYDPFWISNSWIFEQKGWDVYCIEPNPHCIPRLKEYRKNVLEYACASKNSDAEDLFIYTVQHAGPNLENQATWHGEAAGTGLLNHGLHHWPGLADSHKQWQSGVVKVKTRTLDWFMENEIKEDHIDYLSIDVERNELDVLRGISLSRWAPKVIAIENLGREFGRPDLWDDVWKNPEEQEKLLQDSNYRFVHRMSVNDIYMNQDYWNNNFSIL